MGTLVGSFLTSFCRFRISSEAPKRGKGVLEVLAEDPEEPERDDEPFKRVRASQVLTVAHSDSVMEPAGAVLVLRAKKGSCLRKVELNIADFNFKFAEC